jgi:hypothetical protein
MDTWIVSRKPIGLYEIHPSSAPTDAAASPKVRLIQFRSVRHKSHKSSTLVDLRVFLQGTHYDWSSNTRRICHRLCLAHKERNLGTREPTVLGWY